MRSLFHCLLVFCGLTSLPLVSYADLAPTSCSEQLDKAVSVYTQGNTSAAAMQLENLATTCANLPQVHHNLGVIAGSRQQWTQAAEHFNRALADDHRSNDTRNNLQAILQYKASLAYQNALGTNSSISLPELNMQNSSIINASYAAPPKTGLHNTATIDYELFAWWNAAASNATPDWLEHYVTGYPPLENTDAQTVDWDTVDRDISLTAQDAVVVLGYQMNNIQKRVLLLLRLQNNRWKIYRETAL